MPFILTSFTPAEVAEVTGLSTMMQRDWRRRGFLPASVGHARFDPFDLANVAVMKLLADRGVGPAHSGDVAHWAAIGVVWHALHLPEAYDGDHLRTFEWEPEGRGAKRAPDGRVLELAAEARVQLKPEFHEPRIPWAVQAPWLARRILSRRRVHTLPERFLVWWADETHTFVESLDEAFSGVSTSAEYAGPVVVIDLPALASTLMDRLACALVSVKYDKNRSGDVLSPDPEIESGNFGGAITKVGG